MIKSKELRCIFKLEREKDDMMRISLVVPVQKGLPEKKETGNICIISSLSLDNLAGTGYLFLHGYGETDPTQYPFITVRTMRIPYDYEHLLRWDKSILNAVESISNELFNGITPKREVLAGEYVFASNNDEPDVYDKRKLIAILPPTMQKRYICQWEHDQTRYSGYDNVRRLPVFNFEEARASYLARQRVIFTDDCDTAEFYWEEKTIIEDAEE